MSPTPEPTSSADWQLRVTDAHLHLLFTLESLRHASVSEYAAGSGLDVMDVLAQLRDGLDAKLVALEIVGDEVFIHTRPAGSPNPDALAPNLWEVLRLAGDADYAYSLWRLIRSLEQVGWRVLVRPERARSAQAGFLSLSVRGHAVPVVAYPDPAQLSGGGAFVATAGERVVAVTVPAGRLEEAVTAIRRHLLGTGRRLEVIVLEAPSHQPVIVSSGDAAVRARHVSIEMLQADDGATDD